VKGTILMFKPEVMNQNGNIKVLVSAFEGKTINIKTEFVLDLNPFPQVIGIEILNLKLITGENCLKQIKKNIKKTGDGLRYSYDEETDSFYLQLVNEDSKDQLSVDGVLGIDSEGSIVYFEASYR
jgi:uncharacterized protein YuzE